MTTVIATGILAIALHVPTAAGSADQGATIQGLELKHVKDSILYEAMDDTSLPEARRSAISREIALRNQARSDPQYGKAGPRLSLSRDFR